MTFKLRPWEKEDLKSLCKHACNKNITNFMSDGFPDTKEKWEKFLEFVTNNNNILYFAIEVNGEAVGSIGLSPEMDSTPKNAELGYWLSKKYWGQGIMSEAIKEIIQIGFKKHIINRIYAKPYETNAASHRILEKNGFKLETRNEKKIFKNGKYLNESVYAIYR